MMAGSALLDGQAEMLRPTPAPQTGSCGCGVDIVDIEAFGRQLDQPGSRFSDVFTDYEWRWCSAKPHPASSFAGCWAAKEAAVKAWSQTLYGTPPPIEEQALCWRDISVRHDQWGRPRLSFAGRVGELMENSGLSASALSITHDGAYALAWVRLDFAQRP